MATNPTIKLKIVLPDGLAREEVLSQDNSIVGSGPSATIRLSDPRISSAHFMLKVGKSGEVTLLDLGSEAGTRLRGQAIKEPTALASGDQIQVGGTKIKVVFGDADATDVVPIGVAAEADEDRAPKAVQAAKRDRVDTVRARAVEGPMSGRAERKSSMKAQAGRAESSGLAGAKLEGALSTFQGATLAIGPNGNRMLNEEFSSETRPTDSDRRLEVALLWGDTVIDVKAFDVGQGVRIGPGSDSEFRLYSDALGQGFQLVSAGPSARVATPPGGKTFLRHDGSELSSTGEVELGLDDRCMVTLETTNLILRWIRPAKILKTGFFDSVDFYFTKVLSVAFMIHLVVLIGFWITPTSNDMLSEDLFKNPSAFAKLLIKPPEKEKKKKFDLSGVKEGAKAKGKEGKFGKKEAKKEDAAPSKKGAPIVNAHKREEDRTKIMKAGLLGALGGATGAESNIFGPGGLGTGINNALGGLKGGAGMGDAHGVGGLGSRGTGPGGGGTALGIGGLGTKGNGHGRGGFGSIDLGGRGKGDTRIVPGRTIVQGSLSKEIIGKIIRRHWNEIKYCYETELNKNPNLYGKVAVAFTIDGTGVVSDANIGESTMNNTSVENCMVTRVRRWRFPEPKGGGQVFVTYPWVFKAAGDTE